MLINLIDMFPYANVRLLRINKRASYMSEREEERNRTKQDSNCTGCTIKFFCICISFSTLWKGDKIIKKVLFDAVVNQLIMK